MSIFKEIPLDQTRSWTGFGVGLAVGVVAAAAVGYLWKYSKYRCNTDDYLQPGGVNTSQQLTILSRSSSRPVTPVHSLRSGDSGRGAAQHASPGSPHHDAARRHDGRLDVGRERGVEYTDNQGLLHLLYNMAEDQSRKESYVHRGISCNQCNASPICGNRFKCANCIDYDICERCEAHDRHNRRHVFIKIKIPIPPLANPRNALVKPFYPGKELQRRRLTLDEMQRLKSTTYFDQHEIEALFDQYRTLCTKDRGITRDVYDLCLGPIGLEKNLVMDRLFKFYDANGDGYIDFEEFVRGLSILIKGTPEEKVRYAFEGYDLDGAGCVSRDNLRKMFKAYFYITIELVRDVVKACEEEMMANFDDTQGRPVSSLFSAPIPTDTGPDPSQITKTPFPGNPGSREDMWPVMEAMSQDAIEEMVENIFRTANVDLDQRITLQQFRELTAVDSSLLAWFDALGTVF
ncbi:uncharacterized protein LOC110983661 [Acanthaster planci]|uniref:Uncharacterized protein LOC110983661 n=1 Tax=Acanthaster planci TaxID=133434 RepID=A0A8B7Z619_ACAPL|nr:uncharacterized protein LOC110983661 [Acanthaster planci]XP_022098787.1 uncharacterized protein LOC110983661 [Acanthaster planci]